ncbi:MAG: hypothetical protein QW579_00300 [Desulfurococcaceae archaeon]
MIPLPGILARVIKAPLRFTGGYLRSIKEIALAIILYTAIFIAISYVLMLMSLC